MKYSQPGPLAKALSRLASTSPTASGPIAATAPRARAPPPTPPRAGAGGGDGDGLPERVRAATDGAPVRLGIDAIAGEITLRLVACLADGGTLVNYGMLSGRPCVVMPDDLVFRAITLTGFWLAKELREMPREQVEALYADLGRRLLAGEIGAEVEATYAIEEIRAALAHAEREARGGKVLVTPNGPV
jgi:mitochondrial enoyl-[acyl-carrier protein] reductase / trans-2-enoyl-CoA reductase